MATSKSPLKQLASTTSSYKEIFGENWEEKIEEIKELGPSGKEYIWSKPGGGYWNDDGSLKTADQMLSSKEDTEKSLLQKSVDFAVKKLEEKIDNIKTDGDDESTFQKLKNIFKTDDEKESVETTDDKKVNIWRDPDVQKIIENREKTEKELGEYPSFETIEDRVDYAVQPYIDAGKFNKNQIKPNQIRPTQTIQSGSKSSNHAINQ